MCIRDSFPVLYIPACPGKTAPRAPRRAFQLVFNILLEMCIRDSPSVYGHMMDQGYTTDTQTYIDASMNQATYDRAGKTEARCV